MALNSFKFSIMFIILFFLISIIELLKRRLDNSILKKIQVFFLLIFSYYFIYTFNWKFCICIVIVTIISYIIGRAIENTSNIYLRRKLLIIGSIIFILILGYFKYINFFKKVGTFILDFEVLFPIGISFYIFSALSYIIDIYNKKYKAVKNIMYFSLYLSFFPKLIAGPIIKGNDFFPQIFNYKGIKLKYVLEGIQIFILGLFKKIVIADHLNIFVEDIFSFPSVFNTMTVLWGIISYSLQIYFDFAGYSDMAIGISKILGFNFKANFNLPYIANGISDFWKRWHISLSSWFMEYLYIPLGGSKKGNIRTYINFILVMLISGIWHGVGWTFILWGVLHGVASCIERFLKNHSVKLPKLLNIIFTYITVTVFWVFFRAENLKNALNVLKYAFTIHTGVTHPYTWTFFAILCLATGLIISFIYDRKIDNLNKNKLFYMSNDYLVMDLSKIKQMTLFFIFLGLIFIIGYFGDTAFIYGKF